jgi:hypothetical protein
MNFLQILGIIFLALIGLGILAVVFLWWSWRSLNRSQKEHEIPASRIHLNEDLTPEWLQEEGIQNMVSGLRSLGFSQGRAYGVKEIPQVRLCAFFSKESDICAVLYGHDMAGNWVDFGLQYEDGTELTVTNAPFGEEIDTRPESRKIFRKGALIPDLHHEMRAMMEMKPIIRINDANFRDEFEKSYARDMQWRNQRGGISHAEIRRVAENQGMDTGNDHFEKAVEEIKLGEIYRWHEECIEHFVSETDMPVSQWVNYEDRFIIVSDQIHPEIFLEYIWQYMDISDEQMDQFEELAQNFLSSKSLFKRINESLSPNIRAEKIGSVSSPIEADIYHVREE